jgi:hypothetical protein
MTPTPSAAVYRNDGQPDWGLGLVLEDRPDRWVLVFEHGGRKMFMKAGAKGLVPVALDAEALGVLHAKVHRRHGARGGARPASRSRATTKKVVARFHTFAEQLQFFEKAFPGGFKNELFTDEPRAAAGPKPKTGYKAAAMALAREELTHDKFKTGTPETLFEAARKVIKSTNIVFPIEGASPFGAIAEHDRAPVVLGLEQLLHGQGDFGLRVERFAASVHLKGRDGAGKRATWPLATVFAALYFPGDQVCVKPEAFAKQGATLGLPAEASPAVSAAGYRRFFDVAKETQRRLLEAGHEPKDLIDVYSFIWRTHKEKPA